MWRSDSVARPKHGDNDWRCRGCIIVFCIAIVASAGVQAMLGIQPLPFGSCGKEEARCIQLVMTMMH